MMVLTHDDELMRSVPSLRPIWSRTGVSKPLAITASQDVPSGFTSILGPQETVQLVYTTSTRGSECSARNGSTCLLLHQREEFDTATHQHEAAARQNIASALARNNEAHHYDVQMHVRQFEREADARFSQRQGTEISFLPRSKSSS